MQTTHRLLALAVSALALAAPAAAEIKTRTFDYTQDGTTLQGFIAWNDAVSGKRPGVLVVHEWWGHNEHARTQAKRLAEAGYVGMALDMFGKGKVTTHPSEAQAFMAEAMKDPAAMTARFEAARKILEADPHVDPARIAAIGYCFGGAVVLARARAGENLKAVATFHGALATQTPAAKGAVKAPLLVMTGAADTMVPPPQVAAFEAEMKAAGATYEVVSYPGAMHGFTNPDADKAGMAGLKYDAAADRASWERLLAFFKKTLA